jgi:hypothetical protein
MRKLCDKRSSCSGTRMSTCDRSLYARVDRVYACALFVPLLGHNYINAAGNDLQPDLRLNPRHAGGIVCPMHAMLAYTHARAAPSVASNVSQCRILVQYTQHQELQLERKPTQGAIAPPPASSPAAGRPSSIPNSHPLSSLDHTAAPKRAHTSGTFRPLDSSKIDGTSMLAQQQQQGGSSGAATTQGLPPLSQASGSTRHTSASSLCTKLLSESRQGSFSRRLAPLVRCSLRQPLLVWQS